MKVKNKARPTLPPYWVSKMSPSLGLATLHSVKPPTEKGLPVATLINWLPDSDHFHSWFADPVNDHISSLSRVTSVKAKGVMGGLTLQRQPGQHCLCDPQKTRRSPKSQI